MSRIVAVSPHLDDAVFSAGGTLARLAAAGHDVLVLTVFTGSVDAPTGFALACQTDKGLAPDVDYMALRRDEDAAALARLGVRGEHRGLLEAPHRGYDSPAALFAGRREDDDVADAVTEAVRGRVEGADLVLAPQAVGDHVDHQVVTAVVAGLADPDRTAWWRDTPYAVRHPDALGAPGVAGTDVAVDVTAVLDTKAAAARAYATQVGFQFGGPEHVAPVLAELARAEGAGRPVEVLRAGATARAMIGTLEP
ncbi:LmbE family N-acetylglucosaminyl deacetylase [Actinomycetospora succinea]|uniref:LmbE family N-acetylglucosaminyl deacetylase n=1 Tax=Actinomycetospora succinea TaxID=663603 RepID=A0A4R6UYY5_9PSEU|nr:PIG-L family deacetylase [Actinomycetospora succinea]TDQ52756.1 LmbE family N-acetylglucosaminyl deacetylase [Actinomycetospora succinea]